MTTWTTADTFPKYPYANMNLANTYTGGDESINKSYSHFMSFIIPVWVYGQLGAVSIRKTVLPGMAIPMLKIRRPNGRLIFNIEIAIRR